MQFKNHFSPRITIVTDISVSHCLMPLSYSIILLSYLAFTIRFNSSTSGAVIFSPATCSNLSTLSRAHSLLHLSWHVPFPLNNRVVRVKFTVMYSVVTFLKQCSCILKGNSASFEDIGTHRIFYYNPQNIIALCHISFSNSFLQQCRAVMLTPFLADITIPHHFLLVLYTAHHRILMVRYV